MTLTISSPEFEDGGAIPSKFTCEGEDASPVLRFSGVPAGAKTLVLIVDDPDAPDPAAPKMTWVHWVIFNLPPDTAELGESVEQLPAGAENGLNDWKRTGWGGPCPPTGRHRYFFKLYALDTRLEGLSEPRKDDVLAAIKGHVIAEKRIIGTYKKTG